MILQVRKNDFNKDCWNEILSIFTEHGHHVKNYHIFRLGLKLRSWYTI